MDEQITERVLTVARGILEKKTTIRSIALIYGVSKSTVHKDLTERLFYIDQNLHEQVRGLLEYNKSVRHIRGGNSTKLKYSNSK